MRFDDDPLFWAPKYLQPIRPLNFSSEPSPPKAVWECVDSDGRSCVVKVVHASRQKSITNEFLALTQLGPHFTGRVKIPHPLWMKTKGDYILLSTDYIKSDSQQIAPPPKVILYTLNKLSKLPCKIKLDQRRDPLTPTDIDSSLFTSYAKDLVAHYLKTANRTNKILKKHSQMIKSVVHGDFETNHFLWGFTSHHKTPFWYIIDWEHAHCGNILRDCTNLLTSEGILASKLLKKMVYPWHVGLFPKVMRFIKTFGVLECDLRIELQIVAIFKLDYLLKYGREDFPQGKFEVEYLIKVIDTVSKIIEHRNLT